MRLHSGKAEKSTKAEQGQLVRLCSFFFSIIVYFESFKADNGAVTNRWSLCHHKSA